jgi:16S rRNA processing protein RimM
VSEASKHGKQVHLATVVAAHGIRGEVKVKSLTAIPADFSKYGPLQSADGRSFAFSKIRPSTEDVFICTLMNVKDRNAAEALRGVELFVEREKLPAAAAGEVYLADIEGKMAYSGRQALGKVTGFQNFGAGDLLELQDGQLIPTRFIASHDADGVQLDLPAGFLDKE